jgi:AmmeMemoRadiSam system protein B
VAGVFYPGDAHTLTSTVEDLLERAATPTAYLAPRVMVVPHAGYLYSGAIAACAFRRLRTAQPARAFIIGPSHVEAFDFTSIFEGAAYRTPIGDVPVDEEAAHALAQAHPGIRRNRAGHVSRGRGEHAIEVELPFLQRVSPQTRVVPIVMGSQSWDACAKLGDALRDIVDWNHDVVVASSDLSHFYDDTHARALDGAFCETLVTLDAAQLQKRLERGECEACGGGAVVAALLASDALGDRGCEIIARGNSGDVSGDRSSVVGYVAAVVSGEPA